MLTIEREYTTYETQLSGNNIVGVKADGSSWKREVLYEVETCDWEEVESEEEFVEVDSVGKSVADEETDGFIRIANSSQSTL